MSPPGWYSTCGPTSRNFAGSRGVQMSGGSTRWASTSMSGGIFAISSCDTSVWASCTKVEYLQTIRRPRTSPAVEPQTLRVQAEGASKITALPYLDAVELEPRRHRPQFLAELPRDRPCCDPRLGERALHDQCSVLAVCLEVHARHERVSKQERQHVVAVHALRFGDVDLDAVVEPEHALDAVALPDHRVER